MDSISGGMEKDSEFKEGQNRWERMREWNSGDLWFATEFWSSRIASSTRRESDMSRSMTSHAGRACSPISSFRSSRTRI